jgi:chromosomal replication initiation ATPase DnaA
MKQHDKCAGLLLTWTRTCELLKKRLHRATYEQWFDSIVPVRLDGEQIVLGVSDDFFADWLKENYGDILNEALSESAGRKISFILETGHVSVEEDKASVEIEAEANRKDQKQKNNPVRPDTFCELRSRRRKLLSDVAAKTAAIPRSIQSAVYLRAPESQTHLLQAVANRC